MIRHPITWRQLSSHIKATKDDWFSIAQRLEAALPAKPKGSDFKSMWGEIKNVYITLQGGKCVYCETLIEGRVSNDVEHFRPKCKVRPWKVPSDLVRDGITVTTVVACGELGYPTLAYHPLNYAASCKHCNTVLKKNYFPLRASRSLKALHPAHMKREKCYLIYPISTIDDDPEALIEFYGVVPRPKQARGTVGYKRARVTIALFGLDDPDREELFTNRAYCMALLDSKLRERDNAMSDADRTEANRWVRDLTHRQAPHANCTRSLLALYGRDPAEAKVLVREARRYVKDPSP